MKKMEQESSFRGSGSRMLPGDPKNPDSYKVRRGKVGGFSDYFDEDQVNTIEQLLQQALQPVYGYSKQKTKES